MNYYFAYGSNINEQQMRKRCPESKLFGKGFLCDYQLDFTISDPERWGGGGCADVVSMPGGKVWGLIYEMGDKDEISLDNAEGSRYRKIYKEIDIGNGKKIKAFLYEVIDKAPFKKPSNKYLRNIKNGALEHKFNEEYINFLLEIDTID